jgi:hypothetical protein
LPPKTVKQLFGGHDEAGNLLKLSKVDYNTGKGECCMYKVMGTVTRDSNQRDWRYSVFLSFINPLLSL